MQNKLPPHNIDAEECVLGSILIDSDAITKISIDDSDFYSERNRWIFSAFKRLSQKNVGINQITTAQELNDVEKLEGCGGAAFLSHLIGVTPTSLDIEYYADIVNRMSFYRKMINASEKISEIGYQASSAIPDSLNKADDLLLELRKGNVEDDLIDPHSKAMILMDRYVNLKLIEGEAALSTGLIDLDYSLGGGVYPGELFIVAGRPSMGKTSFMQNLARKFAYKGNIIYFSAEMNVESLGDRDVSGDLGIPISRLRLGKYDDELFTNISRSVDNISHTTIYTYDKAPLTTSKISQFSTALKMRKGLAAIIIDYLGQLDDDTGENRNITLGYITRKLKQLAMRLDIPVVLAHQLSRDVDRRDDKRPVLSDLRESGHIEEDADVVMFLYRDAYYYKTQEEWNRYNKGANIPYPENITEGIIAKQRQGDIGRVQFYYDKLHQSFKDLARE